MKTYRFQEYCSVQKYTFLLTLLLCAAAHAAPQFLDDEAEPQTNVAFTLQPSKEGRFTLVFDWQNDKNFYALDCAPGTLKLRSTKDGATENLGETKLDWKTGSRVTLKRRPWLMQVIVNETVALTAYDATFDKGQIGLVKEGGWDAKELRVQPVEPLYFADDFTRAQGEGNEWKAQSGEWKLTASSENINESNSDQSSNPFSFEAIAPKSSARAVAGHWFWDNYEAEVSARPNGRGTIGIAAYVQDGGRDYLAFTWDGNEGPAARKLIRVQDGKATTILQAPGAFLPRQWYRLSLRTSPGYVEAFIDGAPVFRARDNSFGQGGIGLLAQNISSANFDDMKVRSYDYYRQSFAAPGALGAGGAWRPIEGAWDAQDGAVVSSPVKGDYTGRTRMLLVGRDEWNGYAMSAQVAVGPKGGGGLVAGYKDGKNYIVFRWAGSESTLPFKGRQQLLRYHDGKANIVSDETMKLQAGSDGWAKLTLRYSEGALSVYSDGELIAQTADETLSSGRAGFYAQGLVPVKFREVVMFFPPEPEKPKVAPKMEEDKLMVASGWATTEGEWPVTKIKDSLEYWNTGEFFGDASLQYPWRPELFKSGQFEVSMGAESGNFNSGEVVRVAGDGTKDSLKVAILRGDKILRETGVKLNGLSEEASDDEAATIPLKIEREGRSILVSLGGVPVLSYLPTDAEAPAGGTRLAARSTGMPMRVADLLAFSANRDDYTFTQAPTDWYSPQGEWSVFSRWPCFNNWSFFGGQGVAPMLWSKRAYGGDIVVEIYAHNQMDMPKEIGYSHAGDLNITLGGDGKNPASGYSFITAGWANTHSAIMKGSQVVAENREEKSRFQKPINHNSNYHRRWFYIRAEARRTEKDGNKGAMIKLSLDNEILAEYFDPQPLPTLDAGRVAFWTNDGTMMIARAKIEAQKMGALALPDGLLDAVAPMPAPHSGENQLVPMPVIADDLPTSIVENGGGENEWLAKNPASGGLFAVELRRPSELGGGTTPYIVKDGSKIEMDLMLPNEAKIDLYATIDGQLHLIELSGDQRPDAKARKLGAAWEKGDSNGANWRHVSFDVGAALKKMYPDGSEWKITSLQLGALHGDPYRWDGFFGNPMGVSYRLRNARVE